MGTKTRTLANNLTSSLGVSGKVLQAVTTTDNTHISQSNNTNYSEINTTITPSSTSSKIVVMVSLGGISQSSTLDSAYIIERAISGGSTSNLEVGQGATRNCTFLGTHNTGGSEGISAQCTLLDSPNTTSAITYKVYGHINSGSWVINKRGGDTTSSAGSRMVLMEVGA